MSKTGAGVHKSNRAPSVPPISDAIDKIGSEKPLSFSMSSRRAQAPDKYPGNSARVPVALAASGGTPANTSAGRVRKLPPPATAFNAPAKKAATNKIEASVNNFGSPAYLLNTPTRIAFEFIN